MSRSGRASEEDIWRLLVSACVLEISTVMCCEGSGECTSMRSMRSMRLLPSPCQHLPPHLSHPVPSMPPPSLRLSTSNTAPSPPPLSHIVGMFLHRIEMYRQVKDTTHASTSTADAVDSCNSVSIHLIPTQLAAITTFSTTSPITPMTSTQTPMP
jgi:hypothetical protein